MAAKGSSVHSMWRGAINFGLVSIPVKLYPAVREQGIAFHMLHDQDHARLRRTMVCSADGKEVHSEHTVKGYEIAPDKYVIIEESELEAVQSKKSRTIAIEDFVDLTDIDPVYYDRPYYLVPEETGVKPYRLLVEALQESKRVGIARFVMHNKEYLAAIRPIDDALVMETMRFDKEVVPVEDLEEVPRRTQADSREVKMAGQLIESLYGKFSPGKYKDEYTEAVKAMIERKAAGQKIAVAPEPNEPSRRAGSLLDALQASLDRACAGVRAGPPPPLPSARAANPILTGLRVSHGAPRRRREGAMGGSRCREAAPHIKPDVSLLLAVRRPRRKHLHRRARMCATVLRSRMARRNFIFQTWTRCSTPLSGSLRAGSSIMTPAKAPISSTASRLPFTSAQC